MLGAEEPHRGTPLAAGSWQCPGPRPSLTMMATPENMTAETSCQTLRGRKDRTQREHGGDPIAHTSQSIPGCLLGRHPPISHNRGS